MRNLNDLTPTYQSVWKMEKRAQMQILKLSEEQAEQKAWEKVDLMKKLAKDPTILRY